MPRYMLKIEYDGAPFAGWQVQAAGLTVQGVLTAALQAFSGEAVAVQGAGRTDAGVHARGQVAHVDLGRDWDTDTVRDAVNAHLRPHPVAILSATQVADDFNARTSARRRHYLYRIVNRRAHLALESGKAGLAELNGASPCSPSVRSIEPSAESRNPVSLLKPRVKRGNTH